MSEHASAEKKSFDDPDETLDFGQGVVHLVTVGGVSFDRSVFEPGWKWSQHVKPVAGTDSCEFPHRIIVTAGSLHVRMDDGTELEVGAGEAAVVAPGHDAWVSSDVPCVMWGIEGDDRDWGKPPS